MLPFIVGAIAGAGAVVAIKNRKEIKEKVVVGATKVKDKACEVKQSVVDKVETLKTKELKFVDKEKKVEKEEVETEEKEVNHVG